MLTLILTTASPKPGPHTGWTRTELWVILLIAGLIVTFVAVVFLRARMRPR